MAKMTNPIGGIWPALPTPLTEEARLDEKGLQKLVRHVLDGGVRGLWALGSTAEFPALDERERRVIIDICKQEANGKVPVIVGITDLDFATILRRAEQAAGAGADACFATLPYYYTLDFGESVQYLKKLAKASPLPFVFYDNPFSTNVRFDAAGMLEIASIPNLVAIKDSAGDFRRFLEVTNSISNDSNCVLLQGLDQLVGPSLLLTEAPGAITALASIMPTLFVQLFHAAESNDLSGFKSNQKRVLALCRLYEVMGAPTDGAFFAGVKAALEVLGICGRQVAYPFEAMPADKMPEVEAVLASCQEQVPSR